MRKIATDSRRELAQDILELAEKLRKYEEARENIEVIRETPEFMDYLSKEERDYVEMFSEEIVQDILDDMKRYIEYSEEL